jgi:hypothetical protein
MQSSPAGLFLRKRQTLGVAHDLANPSVAEQVRVHWRRLADSPMA